MIRMKNRNQAPVNGWQFFQPETGWNMVQHVPAAQWDFTLAVDSIISHRQKNSRFNLPIDRKTVEDTLDVTNALRMQSITNADSYVMSDQAPVPKMLPQHPFGLHGVAASVSRVAAGVAPLVDWIKSGDEAVPQALANRRALICSTCPCNDHGDWTKWFTIPAQAAIQKALQERTDWSLTTLHDDKLIICSACLCPLKLKVHMPIHHIRNRIPKEAFESLDQRCWIRHEPT